MLNYIYAFLLLIIFCNNTQQQEELPPNDCSFFEYLYDGSKYFGRIKPPDVGNSIQLFVYFTQRTSLPKNHPPLKDLLKFESQDPYQYRIDFPTPTEVPKLTKLNVNGQDICLSNGYPPPNTRYHINHNFTTTSRTKTKQPATKDVTSTSPTLYADNPFLQKVTPSPKTTAELVPRQSATSGRCGKETRLAGFVVGGEELLPGQFPWLTAVFKKNEDSKLEFICGGTLLSRRTVITAGHCAVLHDLSADQVVVHLGRHNLEDLSERYVTRNIQTLILHPDYNKDNFADADLAILHLQSPVNYTKYIRPVCLWSGSSDIDRLVDQIGIVAGWGADGTGRISTAKPKKVKSQIVSDTECLKSSSTYRSVISDRTFCAGSRDGTGPCFGDSGSGLLLYRNRRWYIRGIVSAGQTKDLTCDLYHYVVFTDVAKHLDWIERNISE